MKIKSFHAEDVPPLQLVEATDLSDVVVIAGPNGVGKTRLVEWMLVFFRNPRPNEQQWMTIEATSASERSAWGKSLLETRNAEDCNKLRSSLHKNRQRSKQESTVLYFESSRSIADVGTLQPTWDFADPWLEMLRWDFGFNSLAGRFTDTVHSIFKKIRSRRDEIARHVESLIENRKAAAAVSTSEPMDQLVRLDPSHFPDPIEPFTKAFSLLLAPKVLDVPNPREQTLYYRDGSERRPIDTLSSGEREVVNIVFDFLLRNPNDSIMIFDEPELHLHPELSFKLLQTLKQSGLNNQFIFCTHSPDIITAALDNSVVFISPPRESEPNQAIAVREGDETHQALRLIGQSIGIVALGKRLVLIEGDHTSLDKQTYGAILQGRFPNLVLVPSGGKETLRSFSTLVDRVFKRTIWGVEFFMLCDRDAVPAAHVQAMEVATSNRLRALKRYHLENYFLDENVIAEVFKMFGETWLTDAAAVNQRLRSIARDFRSYAVALIVAGHFREKVGNLDIMPKGVHGEPPDKLEALLQCQAATEYSRIGRSIAASEIATITTASIAEIEASFLSDESSSDPLVRSGDRWKAVIPGRPILQVFCGSAHANFDFGRFKTAYLKVAGGMPANPFQEIVDIFSSFDNYR